MSVEVEAKLKVDSHDPVRSRLHDTGAEHIGAGLESDCHYDSVDGRLRASDSVLRIRSVRSTDGEPPGATLTYKGPRLPGRLKRRPEIQTEITDPDAAGRLLEALGFVPISTIEKRRESWRLLDCRVELDEVPHLGTFVEIEGPDEERISHAQRALGLDHLEHVTPGYVALLFDYCRKHGLPVDRITFDTEH
jgi:predicted adenylyl cyclase CyaB